MRATITIKINKKIATKIAIRCDKSMTDSGADEDSPAAGVGVLTEPAIDVVAAVGDNVGVVFNAGLVAAGDGEMVGVDVTVGEVSVGESNANWVKWPVIPVIV